MFWTGGDWFLLLGEGEAGSVKRSVGPAMGMEPQGLCTPSSQLCGSGCAATPAQGLGF